jgi:hypothetical protein
VNAIAVLGCWLAFPVIIYWTSHPHTTPAFLSGMDEMGPVTKKLYETLTGIQMGRIEAPKGWIYTVD